MSISVCLSVSLSQEEHRAWRRLYPTWMLTKLHPLQRRLSVIRWMWWHVLQSESTSFPGGPSACSTVPWTKSPWWKEWRPHMASKPGLVCPKADRSHHHCWMLNLPATETNAEPLIWHHSMGCLASSIMEGTAIRSLWNRQVFWIWICLPCFLPAPPLMDI